MKSDVIRKRARHDARRGASGHSSETPSASPGASRRASPIIDGTSGSPGSEQSQMYDEQEYIQSSSSELMGALGNMVQQNQQQMSNEAAFPTYYHVSYPGPYHPDYLPPSNNGGFEMPADIFGDATDFDADNYTISIPNSKGTGNVDIGVFDKVTVRIEVEKDKNTQRGRVKMTLVRPVDSSAL